MLKPGGRTAYYNIFVAEGLPVHERRRAGRDAAGAYTRAAQQALLRSAGFVNVRETDVTDEYLRVQRALIHAYESHEASLRLALGDTEFEGRLRYRRGNLASTEAGVRRRSLFAAERP